tara:strand:+ start:13065 stop:13358 length:294 start_codon:yes stop_codon:yes gene_type:complete
LTKATAVTRQPELGENNLPVAPPKPAWKCFLCQSYNVLIYVLIASALVNGSDGWELHGDAAEGALLTLAMKHGLTAQQLSGDWPRIDILPFARETGT